MKINGKEGIKPLHVINGEVYTGDLQDLNPENIESINIVKGEAATKKYGDKGKNGVVEIQLKKEVRLEKIDKNGVAHYRTIGGNPNKKSMLPTHTSSGEKIHNVVDHMPRFPGCGLSTEYSVALKSCGDEKMLQFIYENVKYPETARKKGIEGTVVIRFLVEKDGTTSDAEILRNVGGGTGEEALRVVNLMKEKNIKWIPGQEDGKKVNVNFNLPVKFKLEDDGAALEIDEEKTKKLQESIENFKKQNAELEPGQYKEETTTTKKITKENIIYHPDAPKIPIGYKGEAVSFKAGLETLTLNVFPNPVRDRLSVTLQGEAKDILVTVYDFSGKEFFREEVTAFDGVLHRTIDLQNAPAGTLIVNIRHKGKNYQKKVIVQ